MNLPNLRRPDIAPPGPLLRTQAERAALFGTPSPAIGQVLCALSDVAIDGTFNGAPGSKKGRSGRVSPLSVGIGGFFGMAAGVGIGIGLLAFLNESSGLWVLIPAVLCAILGALATHQVLAYLERFEPECVYVGTHGVERFQRLGFKTTQIRHTVVPYANAACAVHQDTAWTRGSYVSQITELCQLVDASGKELITISSASIGSATTAEADLVRAVNAAYLRFRAPQLMEQARRGQPVRFPIFSWNIHTGFQESGQFFVFGGGGIALHGPGGTRAALPLGRARARVEAGTLHLEADGQRLPPTRLQDIGDGDALVMLVRSTEPGAQAWA